MFKVYAVAVTPENFDAILDGIGSNTYELLRHPAAEEFWFVLVCSDEGLTLLEANAGHEPRLATLDVTF